MGLRDFADYLGKRPRLMTASVYSLSYDTRSRPALGRYGLLSLVFVCERDAHHCSARTEAFYEL